MTGKIEYLSDINIFAGLCEEDEFILARAMCRKSFPVHALICSEGANVQFLIIIVSGRASSVLVDENGDQVIVDFYCPGEIIGDLNPSDEVFYNQNIVTLEPTEVLLISRQAILQVIQKNNQLAIEFAQISASRINHLQARLRSIALENGPKRIITFISDLAKKRGSEEQDGLFIDWNLSHQAIASACGLTRETVSRLIRELDNKGILTRQGRGWKVEINTSC